MGRFPWVDIRVISQDSMDYRAQEMVKMKEVYRNTYITISTAKAGVVVILVFSKSRMTGLWRSVRISYDQARLCQNTCNTAVGPQTAYWTDLEMVLVFAEFRPQGSRKKRFANHPQAIEGLVLDISYNST